MSISDQKYGRVVLQDGGAADEAAELLKAVAHPLRLRLIARLCRGEAYVNELAETLGVPQAVVSQQLRILRMRGLVLAVRRDGRTYYRLARPHLRQMVRCVESCLERGGRP